MEHIWQKQPIRIGNEIKKVLANKGIPLKKFALMAKMKATTLFSALENEEIDTVRLKTFSELLDTNFFERYAGVKEDAEKKLELAEANAIELRNSINEQLKLIKEQQERILELESDKKLLKDVINRLGQTAN